MELDVNTLAKQRLEAIFPSHGVSAHRLDINEELVSKVAKSGWLKREYEALLKTKEVAAKAAADEAEAVERLVPFVSDKQSLCQGEWYPHDRFDTAPTLGSDGVDISQLQNDEYKITAMRRALATAQIRLDDVRVQLTAARIVSQAASLVSPAAARVDSEGSVAAASVTPYSAPSPMPQRFSLDGLKVELSRIATEEGIAVVINAMTRHTGALELQRTGCQALWRVASSVKGARAEEAAGVAEVLCSTMRRFPNEAEVQLAACGALVNIAKGHDPALPLKSIPSQVVAVVDALQYHPRNMELRERAFELLWLLVVEDCSCLIGIPGLGGAVGVAAGEGIRWAKLLLEYALC